MLAIIFSKQPVLQRAACVPSRNGGQKVGLLHHARPASSPEAALEAGPKATGCHEHERPTSTSEPVCAAEWPAGDVELALMGSEQKVESRK